MGAIVSDLYAEIERCDQLQRRLGELLARTGRLQQLQLAATEAMLAARPIKPTWKTRAPEERAAVAGEADERSGGEPTAA